MTKVSPRDALATLSRMRLLGVAAILEFELPARARKKDVIETLLSSPHTSFELILRVLTPSELMTICRLSGLAIAAADGIEKSKIVDLILGRNDGPDARGPDAGGPDAAARSVASPTGEPPQPELPQVLQPDPEDQLTLRQLESHLWEAANILRGKIDSSDFRHYIFGLLFYKRLSDVWEEEYLQRLSESGDPALAADPEEHRFNVPEEVLWKNVRSAGANNIGERLNSAFEAIEKANKSRLAGVFQGVDFNNRDRFPDATLELLLEHFEKHRLRNADVEPDMLGNAYEYLIAQFADDAGKKGGEFYTPKRVVRLIVECLRPQEGMSVYDPACGSGGMLLEAAHYLGRYGQDPRTLRLYGQEMNLNTWAICQMNLFLHDIDDAAVRRGDTLRDPKHLTPEDELQTFDRVLANPPFSLKNWGHETWRRGDVHGRDRYGCPPPSYGDLAFVQHMLACLAPEGMLGVVLPHGVLFRGGSEGKIRQGLLADDLVEAVIGLPPNLFYGTAIPACVLVINRRKAPSRRGRVLFVNGVREMHPGKNQNRLTEAHVERLAQAFHAGRDQPRLCRMVELEEVAGNDFNLTITRYVPSAGGDGEAPIDVAAEVRELRRLEARRRAAERKMMRLVAELGYDL